tara:strand:+ start:414 stop:608 length:195 start_codon:yes stop_codon:yes gene_type:complete
VIVIEITLRNRASMDYTMLEAQIIVAVLCIMGCGWTSWKLGHQAGIVNALDFLEDAGVIEFDKD